MGFHYVKKKLRKTCNHLVRRLIEKFGFPIDNSYFIPYHINICKVVVPQIPFVWRRAWNTEIYFSKYYLVLAKWVRRWYNTTVHKNKWLVGKN